jgi:hypothetical protein
MARPLIDTACRWCGVVVVMLALCANPAWAQRVTGETDLTAGGTTQGIAAAAAQFRVFGELPRGIRFYGDVTSAASRGPESDVFGAAYPYEPGLRPMELFVEKTSVRGRRLLGVRAGRYRTPFGLYGRGDHGYTGFLRAPIIRYSDYWTLSNNYMELGISAIAGTTRVSAEGSLGRPSDEDEYYRGHGTSGVVRVQGTFGNAILGASYIRTTPSVVERPWATGRQEFGGVDFRWMSGGVQVRGEWLSGRPFDLASTHGGYADLFVHRPKMGPVTAVARVERLDYFAGRFSAFPRRYTIGAKIRGPFLLVGQVNFVHQPTDRLGHIGHTSLDAGLTLTIRR